MSGFQEAELKESEYCFTGIIKAIKAAPAQRGISGFVLGLFCVQPPEIDATLSCDLFLPTLLLAIMKTQPGGMDPLHNYSVLGVFL